MFVLIPQADKALMVWLFASSRATAAKLMELILTKYHSELPYVTPQITLKGKVLTDALLTSLKGQTLIISDGGQVQNHSGKLWSCVKCADKNGSLLGYAKREDFEKKHKGKECALFMHNALSQPSMKGWGKNLDKKSLPGPYGRPQNHVWVGKNSTQNEVKKPAPVTHLSR